MSAQPDHTPTDAPMPPPGPAAAAQLLTVLRADRRADRWVPAFERDWNKALEDSRHSYSLTPLHDVVRTWQLRAAAAPAVEASTGPAGRDGDAKPERRGGRRAAIEELPANGR